MALLEFNDWAIRFSELLFASRWVNISLNIPIKYGETLHVYFFRGVFYKYDSVSLFYQNFTIAAWIRVDELPNYGIGGSFTDCYEQTPAADDLTEWPNLFLIYWYLNINNLPDLVYVEFQEYGQFLEYPTTKVIPYNTWAHFAYSQTLNTYYLSVNGIVLSEGVSSVYRTIGHSLKELCTRGMYTKGTFDDLYIFNRGLSIAEVISVMDFNRISGKSSYII